LTTQKQSNANPSITGQDVTLFIRLCLIVYSDFHPDKRYGFIGIYCGCRKSFRNNEETHDPNQRNGGSCYDPVKERVQRYHNPYTFTYCAASAGTMMLCV